MAADKAKIWPALVVIALTVPVVLLFNYILFQKEPAGQTIYVEFEDASGLVKNSSVKVGGIDAGQITELELDQTEVDGIRRDVAVAEIKLDEQVGPIGETIREDATAAARPVNLLGEKYIDLDLGSEDAPFAADESWITQENTSIPVELDDVLNILDEPTRARLRILINEAGIGLAGRGANFNGMLEQLPPAIDELKQFVNELNAENENLKLVIEQGDRVLDSIAEKRKDLGRLVGEAGDVLEHTANQRTALAQTFVDAPNALDELTLTLGELDVTAQAIKPAAADLRQASGPLEDTLDALPGFADASVGTLKKASEVAPTLTKLGNQSTPTIQDLKPTLNKLAKFAKTTDQITIDFADGGVFDHMLGTMHGWANAIRYEDGWSRVFGLSVNPDEDLLTSAVGAYLDAFFPGSFDLTGATAKKASKGNGDESAPEAVDEAPAPVEPTEQPPVEIPDLPDLPDVAPDLPLKPGNDVPSVGEIRDSLLDELKRAAKRAGLDREVLDINLSNRQLKRLVKLPTKKAVEILEIAKGETDTGAGEKFGDGLKDAFKKFEAAGGKLTQKSNLDTTRLLDYLFGGGS